MMRVDVIVVRLYKCYLNLDSCILGQKKNDGQRQL